MNTNLIQRRFSGCARLYGEEKLQRFKNASIAVIGIGGVGSWACEALARSGVGNITMIDLDHLAESNINRQLHALDTTLGLAKTKAMKQRLLDINPQMHIDLIDEFIDPENVRVLIDARFHFVIDCIDHYRTKCALIHHCRRHKIKILTTGGAGGRTDPAQIKVADLSRSEGDALLAKCRKALRQHYGFPHNTQRRFDVPCVYSTEQPVFPSARGGVCRDKKTSASSTGLSCATGLGSCVTVTASFGLGAAAYVLNRL